jgi:NADH-quinone oxidoreductase subunit K
MPSEIPIMHVVLLGATLFTIGMVGVLVRRNMLVILMGIELMLNGANVVFVGYARLLGNMSGHIWALSIMAIAGCETAVGLAVMVTLYRDRRTVDIDDWQLLKEKRGPKAPEFPV